MKTVVVVVVVLAAVVVVVLVVVVGCWCRRLLRVLALVVWVLRLVLLLLL